MKIDKTQYRTIKELDKLSKMKVKGFNPYEGKVFRKGHILYVVSPYFAVAVEWYSLDFSEWQTVKQYYETNNKEYELVFADDESGTEYRIRDYLSLGKEHDEDITFDPDYMRKLLNLFYINKLNPKMIIGNRRLGLEAFDDDVSIQVVLAGMVNEGRH